MKELVFISAVSGVGKSTACEYIRTSRVSTVSIEKYRTISNACR